MLELVGYMVHMFDPSPNLNNNVLGLIENVLTYALAMPNEKCLEELPRPPIALRNLLSSCDVPNGDASTY